MSKQSSCEHGGVSEGHQGQVTLTVTNTAIPLSPPSIKTDFLTIWAADSSQKKSRLANLLPLLNNCANCFPKFLFVFLLQPPLSKSDFSNPLQKTPLDSTRRLIIQMAWFTEIFQLQSLCEAVSAQQGQWGWAEGRAGAGIAPRAAPWVPVLCSSPACVPGSMVNVLQLCGEKADQSSD